MNHQSPLLPLPRPHMNEALACVIVVVESKCGLEPLWRSTYLMKGMRLVSLYLMLCFGAVIRVVRACLGTFLGSFSDALHGELAGEIAVVGRLFGISIISAIRVVLLLALGGEFAFVAFGEAVNQGTDDLQDHIIICGFRRVGQLLSERLIPFVAPDVKS
ncbi:unnamed protein product [Camellia sinensis]